LEVAMCLLCVALLAIASRVASTFGETSHIAIMRGANRTSGGAADAGRREIQLGVGQRWLGQWVRTLGAVGVEHQV
jgi:hypothetical protein